MQRILHNAYLHKALRSFEACCGNAKNAIIIFGHSLADDDIHVLRCIPACGRSNLVIGLYGDPDTPTNRTIATKADELVALRTRQRGVDSR